MYVMRRRGLNYLGWKREVVFRSTYSPVTKQGTMKSVPADVYYHPPEGRKLVSQLIHVQLIEP